MKKHYNVCIYLILYMVYIGLSFSYTSIENEYFISLGGVIGRPVTERDFSYSVLFVGINEYNCN